MGKFTDELELIRDRVKAKYDPKTAAGNMELLEEIKKGERLEQLLKENHECDTCDGYGYITCQHCNTELDCTYCSGGLIAKK